MQHIKTLSLNTTGRVVQRWGFPPTSFPSEILSRLFLAHRAAKKAHTQVSLAHVPSSQKALLRKDRPERAGSAPKMALFLHMTSK